MKDLKPGFEVNVILLFTLKDSLGVEAIKSIFNDNSPSIGHREYYIQPTSALNG